MARRTAALRAGRRCCIVCRERDPGRRRSARYILCDIGSILVCVGLDRTPSASQITRTVVDVDAAGVSAPTPIQLLASLLPVKLLFLQVANHASSGLPIIFMEYIYTLLLAPCRFSFDMLRPTSIFAATGSTSRATFTPRSKQVQERGPQTSKG